MTPGRGLHVAPRTFLLGALVLVTVAVACSPSPEIGPSTVLGVIMTDDWVTPPFVDAVRSFERSHPRVRIDVERISIRQMSEAVRSRIDRGESPDVVQAHAFSAAAEGLAEPVTDLWDTRLNPSEYLPGAVEDVTWEGHRYGVPLDTNALVLMFNAEHFNEAGVPLPADSTTFADLERMAAGLSRADGSQRALAFPTSNWWTYGWIRANGGEVVEVGPDGQAKVTLDGPAVIEAVRFLAGLIQRGHAFPPRAVTSHSGDALALFLAGNAAMHASGSWDLATLQREDRSGRYGAALLPRGRAGAQPGSVLGGSSLYVGKGSRHRSLAFEFMLHLTSDHYAARFAREQGRLPARQRAFDDPHFRKNPELQVFVRQLESAHPFKLEAFPQARKAFEQALDEVFRQGVDAEVALRKAQESARTQSAAR